MSKRDPKAYFKTFELVDGTAFLAIPVRKPRPKSLKIGINRIDDDGVGCVFFEDYKDVETYTQEVRHLVHSTIATSINVRRAIREQVEPKLDTLTRQITALTEQIRGVQEMLATMQAKRSQALKAEAGVPPLMLPLIAKKSS